MSTSGNRTFPACLAPLCPAALGSVSAELKEAGLFRVQAERELCQALLEIDQETLRYGFPLMRASACVTASRLCVRTVLCSSAFLLVRLSPSTDSEAAGGDARVNFYSFFTNAEIQLALFTRLEPGRELLNSKLDLAGSRHVEKERRRYTDRSHPLPRDLR